MTENTNLVILLSIKQAPVQGLNMSDFFFQICYGYEPYGTLKVINPCMARLKFYLFITDIAKNSVNQNFFFWPKTSFKYYSSVNSITFGGQKVNKDKSFP